MIRTTGLLHQRIYPFNEAVVAHLGRINPKSERLIAFGLVCVLQGMFLLLLFAGLRPVLAAAAREVTITLVGGTPSPVIEAPKAKPMLTDITVVVPPPELETQNTPTIFVAVAPAGSPDVTRPATAIASEHTLPNLPAFAVQKANVVRLILSVANDGAVVDAHVAQSSNNAALDKLAIDWVKAHWRYQPALEDGAPIASTTIAIVTFADG